MGAIINLITSFFGIFSKNGVVSFALKSLSFSKMLIINLSILGLSLTYFYFLFETIIFFYNMTNKFLSLFNDLSSSSDRVARLAYDILSSFGILGAFIDVFNLFSPLFLGFFGAYFTRLGIICLIAIRTSLITLFISKI
ncbi:hypothetical protein LMG7974_00216 [Campylobacter majalis]|uniref:Uncharacterized protein n=1 Tax=Campylobacter majalis TaxID=2790656 RepID=A0ABN7K442_9BACT|nr:hypothetical protein [Campylobacter majalis]CAD7287281.1 hypothetical protein LMG7974_00216 [Campylobacter majalis]